MDIIMESTNYLIGNEFYQIKIDENKNIEVLDILAKKSYISGHYFGFIINID